MLRLRLAFALALAALTPFALPQPSAAQDTCVPVAIGVPGQPGPPTWWGGGTGPLDDPRWQGAMSYGHSNDDAQFRALQYTDGTQKYLVLSWDVKADSGGSAAGQDYLQVGFWDPATSKGNVIKLVRSATSSVTDGTFAAGSFSAQVRYRDSSTSGAWNLISALPPTPAWLQSDTLLGASCIAGPPPLCTRWNVRMRVPVGVAASPVSNPASGLPIPDSFLLWYELHVEDAGPSIVRYKFPETAPNVVDLPLTYPEPGTAGHWQAMSTGAGPCAGGVNLDYAQITTDNTPSTDISTVSANVFHARPSNHTGAPIAGNAVRARFRIANWGSVLFDSPEWADISPSAPSCATATGSASPVADGSNFDLSCSWTLTPTQQCEYRPDIHNTCSPMPAARNKHQCVLVELSSSTGVLFSRASAWNNMNFVTTSKFERAATISIKGLPALSGMPTRDVYLYVSTSNLPGVPARKEGAASNLQPQVFRPVGTKEGARFEELMHAGKISFAELAAKMPTYVVRPYYDTGAKETLDGVEHLVLQPMPSYGYYVMHDGEIEGWKHQLTGATEIAPNFYKIAVPHGGAVEVSTSIESVEPGAGDTGGGKAGSSGGAAGTSGSGSEPPPPPPFPWWKVALALLLLVLLIAVLRARKP